MADVDAAADIAAAAASAGSVASAATTRGTTVANSCDNCVYAPPILDALQPRIVMLPAPMSGHAVPDDDAGHDATDDDDDDDDGADFWDNLHKGSTGAKFCRCR